METLNKLVAEIIENHPGGGKPFFDKLDAEVRDVPFSHALFAKARSDHSCSATGFIVSGKFGAYFANWMRMTGSYNLVINVNGGLRDGEPIIDLTPFKQLILHRKFVFLDDSYFSGRTRDTIDKELQKFDAKIIDTYVVYDGSPGERHVGVCSLYRYYNYH